VKVSGVRQVDCLIIGAGVAGASAAYELSCDRSVVVLEREERPGYHSTGRSAALFTETYGNAVVRALTTASKPFYTVPPAGFASHPLLTPRGTLLIGRSDQLSHLDAACAEAERVGNVQRLTLEETLALVPVLRREYIAGGVFEEDARDLDVDAIHQGYLRGLRQRGGEVVTRAEAVEIKRAGERWAVTTPAGAYAARTVVNAAGAWADVVAGLAGVAPIGLAPKRRTAFIFAPPAGIDPARWPAVIDVDETFYFKPEAGLLLGSPANEDEVEPHDVQAEELDVAYAVDRIERATTLAIARVQRKWAGLRSFVADRTPVNGFAPDAPGFYWLAGQGGYGIQTAPAMARLCAAQVRREGTPRDLQAAGVSAAALAPARLTRGAAA
jgi:D-arginine dehydrogenase